MGDSNRVAIDRVNARHALAIQRRFPHDQLRIMRRFLKTSSLGAVGGLLIVIVIVMALFAAQLAPFDPLIPDYAVMQKPPSSQNMLGTDHLGRDVLSRIIFGARITLLVGISSVLIGNTFGFLWGLTSAYGGAKFDMLSQRLLEILMAFPTLILAMLLIAGLGAGLGTIIVAVGITQIPSSTRIVRSVVFTTRETAYVEAAKAAGASPLRLVIRHIAPQCFAPVIVIATLGLGNAIFAEAALSFLGMGVPPPHPSWGNMLGGVLAQSFRPPWWLAVFPGLAIAFTVLGANLLGDGLRDYLDPKVR